MALGVGLGLGLGPSTGVHPGSFPPPWQEGVSLPSGCSSTFPPVSSYGLFLLEHLLELDLSHRCTSNKDLIKSD